MQGVCDGPIIKSVGEVDTTSANEWAYYKVRHNASEVDKPLSSPDVTHLLCSGHDSTAAAALMIVATLQCGAIILRADSYTYDQRLS